MRPQTPLPRTFAATVTVVAPIVALLALAALAPVAPSRARPSATVVTSLADAGPGTLRQAIADAGAGDAVTFAVTGTIQLATPLVITRALAISGPDYAPQAQPMVRLSCQGRTRVLDLAVGATVELANLALVDGNGGSDDAVAGGITNRGSLQISRCQLVGNVGHKAGGILSSGNLWITDSLVQGNRGEAGAGGVYQLTSGQLTIVRSRLLDNVSGGHGGAVATFGPTLIEDSEIRGNAAVNGGGLRSWIGELTVRRSVLAGNQARSSGGAVFAEGPFLLQDSLVADNGLGAETPYSGGGLAVAQADIQRSAIVGNKAHRGAGIAASGIGGRNHRVEVSNSTVAGNIAVAQPASGGRILPGEGGGLLAATEVSLVNVTLTGNSAEAGATAPGRSGGIAAVDPPVLINSIVAGNAGGNCDRPVADGGHNLQHPGLDCGEGIASADPLLAPWTGGGLPAFLPGPGSPAIDAGDAVPCALAPVLGLDQRSLARPTGQQGRCDIGSLEAEASGTPTPGYTPEVTATLPPPDLVPSGLAFGPNTGARCVGPDTRFLLMVGLRNQGQSAAGPFVVAVDGTPFPLAGLDAGASESLRLPMAREQHTVVVDALDQVAERREDNNTLSGLPIVGTAPPPCTPEPPTAQPGERVWLPWVVTARD